MLRSFASVVASAARRFARGDPQLLAAAISFFVFLAIAPVGLACVIALGAVLGQSEASAEVSEVAQRLLGPDGDEALALLLGRFPSRTEAGWFAASALLVALFGASRAFVQIQAALNRVFGVREKPPGSFRTRVVQFVRRRSLSMALVGLVGLSVAVAALADSVLATARLAAGELVPAPALARVVTETVVWVAIVAGFLTIMYRTLPDAVVRWRDAAVGATISAVGMILGARLLSSYLTNFAARSAPAAASTLVVTLGWLYVTGLIALFGAEVAVAAAAAAGREVTPKANAVSIETAPPSGEGIAR